MTTQTPSSIQPSIEATSASARRERYLISEGVKPVPLAHWDLYRRQSPPIFAEPVRLPELPPGQAEVPADDFRLGNYYQVSESEGFHYLTDCYPNNECYYNRQYMLFSAYKHLLGDRFSELNFVDLGGSTGYYSFHASRLGFRNVLCIEGRQELAPAFDVIRSLAGISNVEFLAMNVEKLEALERQFDVVLAQGIMYHTYDHLGFVRQVHRLTKSLAIIDTMLNGRMTTTLDLDEERSDNPRDSPFSSVSLTPSLPVVLRLLKAAGFKDIHNIPFPARVRNSAGNVIDPFRFTQGRRLMLAAVP